MFFYVFYVRVVGEKFTVEFPIISFLWVQFEAYNHSFMIRYRCSDRYIEFITRYIEFKTRYIDFPTRYIDFKSHYIEFITRYIELITRYIEFII